MSSDWIDRHSVTCVLCGGLADERRTVKIWPGEQQELKDLNPAEFRLIKEIAESSGEGEAHQECFDLVQDKGLDPSGVDLEPRTHR